MHVDVEQGPASSACIQGRKSPLPKKGRKAFVIPNGLQDTFQTIPLENFNRNTKIDGHPISLYPLHILLKYGINSYAFCYQFLLHTGTN